jgi:putative addiction module antidote
MNMTTLRVTSLGSATGVILPRELLAHLRVEAGDTLYIVETPRGIELMPHDPALAEQMEVAEEVMRDNHSVLRKLAE